MPQRTRRVRISRLWLIFAGLSVVAALASAEDISVVRLPPASDMTVRLENLTSHLSYDRSGDSYFIVPAGRYSVQILREGRVVYQEAEFIGPEAAPTRAVAPSGSAIVVGLPEGNPRFDGNVCAALEEAARLAISRFGLHGADVKRRLANAEFHGESTRCATNGGMDVLAGLLGGSYGVTRLGMVKLSIDFLPLSPSQRLRRAVPGPAIGNDSSHPNLWTAPLAGLGLVEDLKQGFSDVAVGSGERAFLGCAAMSGDAPLFCNSDSQVVGPLEVGSFRGLYRLHVKTVPVDYRGVEDDHWTTFVGDDEFHATQERLTGDLQRIQSHLRQRIDEMELKELNGPNPVASGQSDRRYPIAELASLLEKTQDDLDGTLHDEKLQPLRRHFPAALAKLSTSSQPYVPAPDAFRVFRELKDTVTVLSKASGDLGVDLVFRTTPVETEGALLTFAACPHCKPLVSEGGQHRFYRGRYYVTASLDGYVPYEGWLDLVDDPKTILECNLVRIHNRNNSHESTCSLKPQ